MAINYVQDRIDKGCFLPQLKTGFSFIDLEEGQNFTPSDYSRNALIYLYEGRIEVSCCHEGFVIESGQLALMSCDVKYSIRAEQHTSMVILGVVKVLAECDYFQLRHPTESYSTHITSYKDEHVLECAQLVKNFYHQVREIYRLGVSCIRLYRVKEAEIFMLLRATMSNEDFCRFMTPFSGERVAFKSKVLLMAEKHNTVNALADAIGLDRSYFQRLFKSEFGKTPSDWLKERRVEKVSNYLRSHDEPLKVVAYELGFPSLAALSNFCRKEIGKTAREIQNESKIEV
jgi:AraC-like DNA-binding protein